MIIHARALMGNKGLYLSYWLAGFSHVRLLADQDQDAGLWVAVEEPLDHWLPFSALRIAAWEASVDIGFLVVHPDRDTAWQLLRDAKYTGMTTEWYHQEMWHVATISVRRDPGKEHATCH